LEQTEVASLIEPRQGNWEGLSSNDQSQVPFMGSLTNKVNRPNREPEI
jgi:hypothetical protein